MDNEKINIESAEIKSLSDYAFETAGVQRGNPDVFKNHLEFIFTGALVDISVVSSLPEEERNKIKSKIDEFEEEQQVKQGNIETIERKNFVLHKKNESLKEELNDLRSGKIETEGGVTQVPVFSLSKFLITSFFLLMLSIFIFFFYVAVVYKALFIDVKDIMDAMAAGEWGVSPLPDWAEVYEALTNNLMVVFAPFIFFGFGYAVHIFLEAKSKLKYLYIFLVIAVTFALDFLLADQIHQRSVEAISIMDLPESSPFKNILLVIIMGFVVYIIWSVIFHAWMKELEKRNTPSLIKKFIRENNKEIHKNEEKIQSLKEDIKSLHFKVSQLSKSLSTKYVDLNDIRKSILEFIDGWFKFLNALNNKESKTKLDLCTKYLNEFSKRNRLDLNFD